MTFCYPILRNRMTKLLEQAFTEAKKLPEIEQDRMAQWFLTELEDEQRWDNAFAASREKLLKLAAEALEDHRAGRTELLDLSLI